MRFTLEIGEKEKHRIDYYRNWFLGTERLQADGEIVASRSVVSLSNYVSFPLCRRYEFSVGTSEPHTVIFEKERPLLFAGVRPHKYRVIVDGRDFDVRYQPPNNAFERPVSRFTSVRGQRGSYSAPSARFIAPRPAAQRER